MTLKYFAAKYLVVPLLLTFYACVTGICADAPDVLILGYHLVEDEPYSRTDDHVRNHLVVSKSRFRQQMLFLVENGFNTITFIDYLAWREGRAELPEKPVILTFDDGYACVYENAYPILKELGMTGVLFVIPGVVGVRHYSNEHYTWDNIRKMMNSGFECGSHTMSHPDLSKLTEVEVLQELGESFRIIEKETGVKPISLAYPRGGHNSVVRRIAQEVGYKMAVTTAGGINRANAAPMTLRRIFPRYNDSLTAFRRLIGQ